MRTRVYSSMLQNFLWKLVNMDVGCCCAYMYVQHTYFEKGGGGDSPLALCRKTLLSVIGACVLCFFKFGNLQKIHQIVELKTLAKFSPIRYYVKHTNSLPCVPDLLLVQQKIWNHKEMVSRIWKFKTLSSTILRGNQYTLQSYCMLVHMLKPLQLC